MTAKQQKNSLVPRPNRVIRLSLTGDVTPGIVEDDWERGWQKRRLPSLSHQGINSWTLNQHLFSHFTPNNSLVTSLMIMMTTLLQQIKLAYSRSIVQAGYALDSRLMIPKHVTDSLRNFISLQLPHCPIYGKRRQSWITDSGFQILCCGTWISDSGFLELYSRFQSPGFQIFSDCGLRIPLAKLSRILESGFPHMGRTRIENVSHTVIAIICIRK